MSVIVRSDLTTLPDHADGGKHHGTILLSNNEMPRPVPMPVLVAITEAAVETHRYPEPDSTTLVGRLADHIRVDPTRLAVGPGSAAVCQQLLTALDIAGGDVVIPHPSFEAYQALACVATGRPRTVPLHDHRVDLTAVVAAITPRTRAVFVSNPHNPTGTALRAAELTGFLHRVPDDVLVVLDEAYQEFITDPDMPDGLRTVHERDNVAVLRTFSKAYGLAGLRVGYLVAAPAVAAAVRAVTVPYSVNRIAQAAATATLDIADQLLARCAEIIAERDRVRTALLDLGFDVPESHANFLWLPLGEHTAAFTQHCADHKIIVRPFPGHGVRVTIGLPDENNSFLAAARSASAISDRRPREGDEPRRNGS